MAQGPSFHHDFILPHHDLIPIFQALAEVVDSGTETDDEFEDPVLGMDSLRSSTSSRPSSTPVGAMRTLELAVNDKENIQPHQSGSEETVMAQHLAPTHLDDYAQDGNHSSEEELEEINKFDSFVAAAPEEEELEEELTEVVARAANKSRGSAVSSLSLATPTPLCETPESNCSMISTHSSSGDEIMSVGVVQFSTSPPTGQHVQRPRRRSSSPPAPKMIFLRDDGGTMDLGSGESLGFQAIRGEDEATAAGGPQPPRLGADRPRRLVSPRKRFRQSNRSHNHGGPTHRPCLDFEKMQQKTRAVSSWRHGGELSLGCW